MPTPKPIRRRSLERAFAVALTLCGAALPALCPRPAAAADQAPAPLTTIKPERGFLDDAFALSEGGDTLYYVTTDGTSFATLRAAVLPAAGAAPAAATSTEVLTGLPLYVTRIVLLPDSRVLVVSRDAEGTGLVSGAVYSLTTRAAVPLAPAVKAALGPATDIVLAQPAGGPAIVAWKRPADGAGAGEYKIAAVSAGTLKLVGQRAFKVRDGDGKIQTAQGSAVPLYFTDDYLTLVAKHDGAFDRKKDVRQPDFVASVDVLTGKVVRARPISDPTALLEDARLHTTGESAFVTASAETQRVELWTQSDRADGQADVRVPLQLPRAASMYDPQTLRYARLRPGQLLVSLTVDPVNERAVAAKRADADSIDLVLVDLSRPEQTRRVLTLPGQKRPSGWAASPAGRLALLRKHKGFSRGGTELEVYDLPLSEGAEASAPIGRKTATAK